LKCSSCTNLSADLGINFAQQVSQDGGTARRLQVAIKSDYSVGVLALACNFVFAAAKPN
jgi:hypothetical protein